MMGDPPELTSGPATPRPEQEPLLPNDQLAAQLRHLLLDLSSVRDGSILLPNSGLLGSSSPSSLSPPSEARDFGRGSTQAR